MKKLVCFSSNKFVCLFPIIMQIMVAAFKKLVCFSSNWFVYSFPIIMVEYSSIYCKIGLFFIQLGSLFVHFQLVSWLAVFEELVCFLSNWFVYQFLISNLVHYSSHMFVITGYWSTSLTANMKSSSFFIHLVCFDIQCLVLVCYLICSTNKFVF